MIPVTPIRVLHNPRVDRTRPFGTESQARLGSARFAHAHSHISSWDNYAPTPLVSLTALARSVGVGGIYYKDEGARFGLGSFKALGGAYALYCLLSREVQRLTGAADVPAADLKSGRYAQWTNGMTVTCATDGNHGRAVAWGARMFGSRCVIFVHEKVSEGRVAAIASYGAEVRRIAGNYDDSVRCAAATAAEKGWFVVSDTSYEDYVEVPKDIMQGYAVIMAEVLEQLPPERIPTHVFVQSGVGSLAAAVCGHLWERFGSGRPRLIVVEPDNAACLFESARAGRFTAVRGELNTIMAGLACGEPSRLAWSVLEQGADDFMTVSDASAADCMRWLAAGARGDPAIVAGESAVAGLAGLLLAAQAPELRTTLGLEADSRILVFGTESDTDPGLYRQIVGRSGDAVRRERGLG